MNGPKALFFLGKNTKTIVSSCLGANRNGKDGFGVLAETIRMFLSTFSAYSLCAQLIHLFDPVGLHVRQAGLCALLVDDMIMGRRYLVFVTYQEVCLAIGQ